MAIVLFVSCGIAGAVLGLLLVTLANAIGFAIADALIAFTDGMIGRLSERRSGSSLA